MRLRPTQWNKKQKTRVATLYVPPGADGTLVLFDLALRHLPPRVYSYKDIVSRGRGRNRTTDTQYIWRWNDSIVRPLVADNLASGRKWYDGFTRLMTERDGSNTPNHERVSYESEGLHAMIHEERYAMTAEEERALISAIHRAINMQRGKIYSDTMGARARAQKLKPNQVCYNRWNRLMQRLRLGLINAKTAEQTRRFVQDDIFGRAGTIKELRDDETLRLVHQLIFHTDWQRLRDLTMLAVVSYKAPTKDDALPGEENLEIETAS
jgi:CRISPR-associated protein Cas8a1/Csx13